MLMTAIIFVGAWAGVLALFLGLCWIREKRGCKS